MNINKLKREIEHQIRNDRNNMYIEYKDILELIKGAKQEVRGKERVYLNIESINQLIDTYEFNITPDEKEKDDFFSRIHIDMPEHKLTRVDERGFLFKPVKEEKER